ncbi:P-loop containing nucleoside triphosphate hydrolase protein [Amanita rubescens]|nr:P-loop containing nucleoside triphosphate hydrolase protein [Amanita rubescens]
MLAKSGKKRKRNQGIFSVDELLKKQEIDHIRTQSDEEEGDDIGSSSDDSSLEHESDEDKVHTLPSPTSIERISLARRLAKDNVDQKSTNAHTPTPLSSFASLGISAPLQATLASMSIKKPTEVQAACIPPLLAGRDCIGNAKTGSGKTIAFALPILQRLSIDPYGIYALVLTPTRELAFQIAEQFAVLGGSLNARTAVVVGGMDMMAQALELDSLPHIVIATPGRIVDHIRSSSGVWNLSRVKFLVLDEADRLLTPTFTPELSYLFNILPRDRQTCLFTATLTPSIETLADAPPRPGKQRPFIHKMTESIETVVTLRQYYLLVPSHVREPYLYHFLCHPPESTLHLRRAPPDSVDTSRKSQKASKTKVKKTTEEEVEQPPPTIIFCARAKTAAYLTTLLKTLHIRSTALHSRLTQRERLSSLSLFRASVVPVLVSTGVGARGLDIEDVAIVINWDLPSEPEEYTHRVGRTARAGRGGVAVSFVTERDEEKVLNIEGRINTKLEEMKLPEDAVLEKLNAVSTAKRLANMELHDSDFGKRERTQRIKRQREV